jgi:hypothetical protein
MQEENRDLNDYLGEDYGSRQDYHEALLEEALQWNKTLEIQIKKLKNFQRSSKQLKTSYR